MPTLQLRLHLHSRAFTLSEDSMEKLSGLVLDVRDDYNGEILRSIFPTDEALPEFVKSAAQLTPELDATLPDDLFAVVLCDGDVALRKFACIDVGNTALSVEYFFKTAHKLPVEAQKVAAENLVTACGWYGIEAPEDLTKIALGLGTALNIGLTAPGMARQAKMNLDATQGAGHVVVTPHQRQALLKGAEAIGSSVMPISAPTADGPAPTKTTIRKVGGATGAHHPECPDDNLGKSNTAETPQRLPQSAPLKPHVNVAGKEPPGLLKLKEAEYYALPSCKMYPLDGADQVKLASDYFDEYSCRMAPEQRREFCVNMVKRANLLSITVSDTAAKYAAAGYAEPSAIEIALDGRRLAIVDEVSLGTLDKLAELRGRMAPEDFAVTLGEFDKAAGIDHLYGRHVMDPYLSTFGEKRAADSVIVGNDFMSVHQLKRLAATGYEMIRHRFGDELANEFVKEPLSVFNSLPLDQKKVMMRMASDAGSVDGEITV